MALQYFGPTGGEIHEVNKVLAADLDRDERQDREPSFGRIDLRAITQNDSRLFHLMDSLRNRGRR